MRPAASGRPGSETFRVDRTAPLKSPRQAVGDRPADRRPLPVRPRQVAPSRRPPEAIGDRQSARPAGGSRPVLFVSCDPLPDFRPPRPTERPRPPENLEGPRGVIGPQVPGTAIGRPPRRLRAAPAKAPDHGRPPPASLVAALCSMAPLAAGHGSANLESFVDHDSMAGALLIFGFCRHTPSACGAYVYFRQRSPLFFE